MLCTFGWSAASRKVFAKKDVPNAVLSWSDVWKRVYPAGLTAALDIGLSNLAITTGLHINIYTVRSRTPRVDRNPKKKKRGGEGGRKKRCKKYHNHFVRFDFTSLWFMDMRVHFPLHAGGYHSALCR